MSNNKRKSNVIESDSEQSPAKTKKVAATNDFFAPRSQKVAAAAPAPVLTEEASTSPSSAAASEVDEDEVASEEEEEEAEKLAEIFVRKPTSASSNEAGSWNKGEPSVHLLLFNPRPAKLNRANSGYRMPH